MNPNMSTQKIAVVTGGSRGIGAAISLTLAAKGFDIALVYTSDSSTPRALEVQSQIAALGQNSILVKADLERADCGEVVRDAVLKGFETQKIDVLVNNAAIGGLGEDSLSTTVEFFERYININTRAPMLLVKNLAPHFNPGGRIISMGSVLAHEPYPGQDAYTASKAALEGLTRQWALTFGKLLGITANVIVAGAIGTDMNEGFPDEVWEPTKERTSAAKRIGTPEDVAGVIGLLVEDGSRWINGQCIGVHGGYLW